MKSKIVIIISICLISVLAEKKSYEGFSVYKVTPRSENDLAVLNDLHNNGLGEFWEDQFYINYEVRVMVSEDNKVKFEHKLNQAGMEAKLSIKDVKSAIEAQLKPAQRNSQESFLSMNWNQYYTLEQIYDWLDEVARNYPNVVTIVNMGQSVQNRSIKGVKINYRPNRNNTVIGMLQGTLHAREWITTSTLTWIIKEFLTSNNPEIRAFAENIEWHLFPVVNPDGYVYTFTTNRMWRKNRSTQSFTSCASLNASNDMSNGVDLNRNFDYKWMTIGASSNPCTVTFAGPSALSEPESIAIAQYVLNLNQQGRLMYFIDFHSYTQLVVIPYSHVNSTDILKPSNYDDMLKIASNGAKKLEERNGTVYRVGISADILYPMSGTTFDWVKNATDIPVSFLIELRDLGEYGFLLPPEQIIPNNLEIMDALLEMDRTTRELGYYDSGTKTIVYSISILVSGVLLALLN